eukprot:TRINITY_DN70433_c0_g1_i1.p1 TRINITY_DN70433_c0_g1~~TRINITY_DN70433_c0_g1_i1.p1  ORF type:complete len:396 (+),score=114.56 TRINITY_DN70433_c0_g1_i1:86-1189(+)
MGARAAALAALLARAGGAAVSFSCSSDLDCSLNGVCSNAVCQCDSPWAGADCGVLLRGAAQPGGIYGYSPNVSSWGGDFVKGDDGLYHLYVAEMQTGGLKGWGSKSECTHAVSSNMSGPFAKRGVALGGPWCHNPAVLRSPATGEYLLFHIGRGKDSPLRSSGFMHHSMKPDGPWTPATNAPEHCNNPAPTFHPNGTLFLVCNNGGFQLTHAVGNGWAPLTQIGGHGSDRDRHWEDPFLWFDRRGNWHILAHVYCLLPFAAHKECYSGHAFSADGFNWTYSGTEPFNGTVRFADGSSRSFSTRERPKFVFGDSDTARAVPIAVITGVSPQPISPACDSCSEGACSQCKVTTGRDWTYTVLEPLRGYA